MRVGEINEFNYEGNQSGMIMYWMETGESNYVMLRNNTGLDLTVERQYGNGGEFNFSSGMLIGFPVDINVDQYMWFKVPGPSGSWRYGYDWKTNLFTHN
ncbi:hypothetical protein FBU30_000674 [Linnemannia zychae]|nr:hypothetical protein FBU30_000674 [Linnemannia zychae]